MKNYLAKDDIPYSYRDIVDNIGIDNFIKLCEILGGGSIYIPTKASILKPARNRIIKEKFDGGNYKELSREFGITEMHIRKIISE